MMRALFRDKDDHTLLAAAIYEINYIPQTQELYCVSPDAEISISMPYEDAESIIEEIYYYGKVDLSSWNACFKWENEGE